MKKSLWISPALAAAAMAVAGPAAAVSSATATISGFIITLYDLDPSDGIVPELTFTSTSSQSRTNVHSSSESDPDSDWQTGNFVPTSAISALSFGQASASTDATSAAAVGSVSGPAYGGDGSFDAFAYGISSGFTLTEWTGMRLTVTFDGTASTGPAGGFTEYASAYARLNTTINLPEGYEYHYAERNASAGCGIWDGSTCSGESHSFSGTFSLNFANFSDASAEGSLYVDTFSYGRSAVPVPEPQIYLMLLAGLVGIAAVVRRRRAV